MKSKGLQRLTNRILKDIKRMEDKKTEIYQDVNRNSHISIATLDQVIDFQKTTLIIIKEVDEDESQ